MKKYEVRITDGRDTRLFVVTASAFKIDDKAKLIYFYNSKDELIFTASIYNLMSVQLK